MRRLYPWVSALVFLASASRVGAFCGFYVAKADTKLFNSASSVALVHDGTKTVLTMSNDFKGDATEFAVVIPVPTILQKDQIKVAERALLDHLDAYSAPRLVEYYDPDPCLRGRLDRSFGYAPGALPPMAMQATKARDRGVTIEARYTVGEYDILILSAKESDGLEAWLRENGYRIPSGATGVLGSYIRQGLHFFVAKVNLKEQSKLGFTYLRPLQISYDSPRFMLPIRLGTVNANGPQELFIFALGKSGRVETTNYRTVKLPTGMEIPLYVKEEFPKFYQALFSQQVKTEDMRVVFQEYGWDMGWCDPCAAEPLSRDELQKLGVSWLQTGEAAPRIPYGAPGGMPYLTRLHVRYDAAHFPEDLAFQETSDRANFQGRYVLNHPWTGGSTCSEADAYYRSLPQRREKEAETLSSLTGWDIAGIRNRMNTKITPP